jgi:hypothetical protein
MAHLHHRGGDQDNRLSPTAKAFMTASFSFGFIFPCMQGNAQVGKHLFLQMLCIFIRRHEVEALFLPLFHPGADNIDLPPLAGELPDEAVDALPLVLPTAKVSTRCRPGVSHRSPKSQVSVDNEGKRTRDWAWPTSPSRWGCCPFAVSAARWRTPKRCLFVR